MTALGRRRAIRHSALWAAYGDALGFITEFVDADGVERRVGTREVLSTVPWRRRIGGRFGVQADLPAGAISDDTQLRLATSRTMLRDGSFDVEAFSKVELVVWLSYALGAGRGSRAAAANLARRDTTWASNFFSGRGPKYTQGGGNGAAMRIQPHVWAARPRSFDKTLRDVLINAICTHGHARGFMGAYFHACCLDVALTGRSARPSDWRQFVDGFGRAAEMLRAESALRDLWLGPWERESGKTLDEAIASVASEMQADIDLLTEAAVGPVSREAALLRAIQALGVTSADQRGSGTKTSLLAAAAAWIFAEDPRAGVLACANALGTDTDTVATMAGALLGPLIGHAPDGPIQDADYISHEADRMWAIGTERPVPNFPFVDLLSWSPPRNQSDVVGLVDGELVLAGLGPAKPAGPSWVVPSGEATFGWMTLWFGQTVLAKLRPEPRELPPASAVIPNTAYSAPAVSNGEARERSDVDRPGQVGSASLGAQLSFQEPLPGIDAAAREAAGAPASPDDLQATLNAISTARNIHQLTDLVIRSGFASAAVGAGLLKAISLGEDDHLSVERAVAYGSIIAKARQARGRG